MSSSSAEVNIWVPAVVVGLGISILAAAIWDVCRRRLWFSLSWFFPCILKEVGLGPNPTRISVQGKEHQENAMLSEAWSSMDDISTQPAELLASPDHPQHLLFPTPSPTYEITIDSQIDSSTLMQRLPISSDLQTRLPASDQQHVVISDSIQSASTTHCNSLHELVNNLMVSQENQASSSQTESLPSRFAEFSHDSAPRKAGTFNATSYFPDGTDMAYVYRVKRKLQEYAVKKVRRWKSSIVLQASLPIDPHILAEMVKVVKGCMEVESRCTLQLGSWGILYYSDGKVFLHKLQEGDVPVNIEARWQENKTGITMYGLHMNGAQIKVADKKTHVALRSIGPASQDHGRLELLHFHTEGLLIGEGSLIHAAKIVDVSGRLLIVRSEATSILGPQKKSPLREAIMDGLHQFAQLLTSSKKIIKSLLQLGDFQSETRDGQETRGKSTGSSLLDMTHEFDNKHQSLLEFWRSIVQMEMLDQEKKVLWHLQYFSAGRMNDYTSQIHGFGTTQLADQIYWQRGLNDMNEMNLWDWNLKQSDVLFRVRGGLKFLTGDFESSLKDFDLAIELNRGEGFTLQERALVKCMLAKFSGALKDFYTAIAINPTLHISDEMIVLLQQIDSQSSLQALIPHGHHFCYMNQEHNRVQNIPDLLTGDEWHPNLPNGAVMLSHEHDVHLGGPQELSSHRASEGQTFPDAIGRCLEDDNSSEETNEVSLYIFDGVALGTSQHLESSCGPSVLCDDMAGKLAHLPGHDHPVHTAKLVTGNAGALQMESPLSALATPCGFHDTDSSLKFTSEQEKCTASRAPDVRPRSKEKNITQYEKKSNKSAQFFQANVLAVDKKDAVRCDSHQALFESPPVNVQPNSEGIMMSDFMAKETSQVLLKGPLKYSRRAKDSSKHFGVRYRPDLAKWVAEVRVAEWKLVDKKVWLGTFDTEEGAARAVDAARKLLNCSKKRHFNFPCDRLVAYSEQIPSHLVLTDLTNDSMFKSVSLFVKKNSQEYAAEFKNQSVEEYSSLLHRLPKREGFISEFSVEGIKLEGIAQGVNSEHAVTDSFQYLQGEDIICSYLETSNNATQEDMRDDTLLHFPSVGNDILTETRSKSKLYKPDVICHGHVRHQGVDMRLLSSSASDGKTSWDKCGGCMLREQNWSPTVASSKHKRVEKQLGSHQGDLESFPSKNYDLAIAISKMLRHVKDVGNDRVDYRGPTDLNVAVVHDRLYQHDRFGFKGAVAKENDLADLYGPLEKVGARKRSKYHGACYEPDVGKWDGWIKVPLQPAWDAEKLYLGTFDTEEGVARVVDLTRMLLKCPNTHPLNFPCERLAAYWEEILSHLVSMTSTIRNDNMFKDVTWYIKSKLNEYAEACRLNPCESCKRQKGGKEENLIQSCSHSVRQWVHANPCKALLKEQGHDIVHLPHEHVLAINKGSMLMDLDKAIPVVAKDSSCTMLSKSDVGLEQYDVQGARYGPSAGLNIQWGGLQLPSDTLSRDNAEVMLAGKLQCLKPTYE